MRRSPRLALTLLIQRQLLPQKEIFRGQYWTWTEAESEIARGIDDEREQHQCQVADVAKLA
jgi:hypothetical protein